MNPNQTQHYQAISSYSLSVIISPLGREYSGQGGKWRNFRALSCLTCLGTEGDLLGVRWKRESKFHWLTPSHPLLMHHPLWFTSQTSHDFTFEFTVATSCILTFIGLLMSLLSYHRLSCKSAWIPHFLIKTCSLIVFLTSALYVDSWWES